MSKVLQTLIPRYRHHSNGESEKAHTLFTEMLKKFSYEAISNHPDYLFYASAEMLMHAIPLIVNEMLTRKDLNYLVYPILSAVNQTNRLQCYKERAEQIAATADATFITTILRLLDELKNDPPLPIDELEIIEAFWKVAKCEHEMD